MNALVTGTSGNLGSETTAALTSTGVAVVSIKDDLLAAGDIEYDGPADCIVHCAGIVHFTKSGTSNEQMLAKVMRLAAKRNLPLYFVSTAFVYQPPQAPNSYITDKLRCEALLASSGLPYAMLRPGVLTGSSKDGSLKNFTGYYQVVRTFLASIKKAQQQSRRIRFPILTGHASMVPVNQVARDIASTVLEQRLGTFFLTTPRPPTFHWTLNETLKFFGVAGQVEFLQCTFEEFGKLDLTPEEQDLHRLGLHMNPFWSLEYEFPDSILNENLVTTPYLAQTLGYFQQHDPFFHEN